MKPTNKRDICTNSVARTSIAITLALATSFMGSSTIFATASQAVSDTSKHSQTTKNSSSAKSASSGSTALPKGISKADLDRLGVEFVVTRPVAGTTQTVSEFRLKRNGLTVLTSERHITPVVMVMMVYRVGSRNEAVGYTGSTHFLEHMMFKGTKRHDPQNGTGLDDVLKPAGGYNNATTSFDRTNYFEIVPSKDINLCLDLESDRMRHLLLRKEDHDAEMTVVRNELERGEDEPQELLQQHMFAAAFQQHPYHHPTIGWRSDVENAPILRLRQFYDEFYWPNNGTLTIIGDINTLDLLKSVVKYFGAIPHSPKPFPEVYTKEPPQEGERRFIVRRGSELPRVQIAYRGVTAKDKDDYALDLIETILGDENKKSSRLYKSMVDTGLASESDANNTSLRDPGLFVISATSTGKAKPEELERLLIAQADSFKNTPVSDSELARAKNSVIKRVKLASSDPMGMGEQLAESIASADWQWLGTYPDKLKAVTAADIQRVARKYFNEQSLTVGAYLPKETPKGEGESEKKEEKAAVPTDTTPPDTVAKASLEQQRDKGEAETADKTPTDAAKPISTVKEETEAAPGPHAGTPLGTKGSGVANKTSRGKFSRDIHKEVLPNGLTVMVMPEKGTGTVAIAGRVLAGQYFRTLDRMLVPDLMPDLLTAGTQKYTKEELAERLEEMGASLQFADDDFWLSFNSEVVTEDLSDFMPLLAETLQHPRFSEDELSKTKALKTAQIKDQMADTGAVAAMSFIESCYKPRSVYYDKPFPQQLTELSSITSADLKQFHQAHVTPANTVLVIVGDVTVEQAMQSVRTSFSQWQGGPRERVAIDPSTVISHAKQLTVKAELPDKSNVEVILGHPVNLSIHSSDYYPALIANAALGYDSFACRLAPVRDKFGLTYSIFSALSPQYRDAPWTVVYSVNPANYTRALSLVEKIVREYTQSGITKDELTKEKSHLEGAFYVALRGPRQIARKLAELEMLGLPASFIDDFGTKLQAVSQSQVNSCIRRYFDLNDVVVSASGTFHKDEHPAK